MRVPKAGGSPCTKVFRFRSLADSAPADPAVRRSSKAYLVSKSASTAFLHVRSKSASPAFLHVRGDQEEDHSQEEGRSRGVGDCQENADAEDADDADDGGRTMWY